MGVKIFREISYFSSPFRKFRLLSSSNGRFEFDWIRKPNDRKRRVACVRRAIFKFNQFVDELAVDLVSGKKCESELIASAERLVAVATPLVKSSFARCHDMEIVDGKDESYMVSRQVQQVWLVAVKKLQRETDTSCYSIST